MPKPDQIKRVKPGSKINIMVYGQPGVGKTVLAGTSPRCLILRPPFDHTDSLPKGSPVEEWVLRDWDDMNEAEEFLRHEGSKYYDWVWLDSISLIQDVGLDHIWADTVARKPDRAKFGLDQGEYGINMFRLAGWMRHVVGIGEFNLGVTAHPFETLDVNDDPICLPYVQGKNMADKVCGYMNVVGHLTAKEGKNGKSVRVLETKHVGLYYGKDQLGVGRMINPTIPKLIEVTSRGAASTTKRTPRPTRRRRTA